jgi:hypothetical protein
MKEYVAYQGAHLQLNGILMPKGDLKRWNTLKNNPKTGNGNCSIFSD